jgi:Ca-activated chloride channel family protein
MDLIRLENSSFMYALVLIPILALIYIFWRISIKRKLEKVGNAAMLSSLMPESSPLKHGLKFGLLMLGLALLILGAANPQIGTKLAEYKREGVDVVIAIDVSNSMMSEDIKPDRLSRAKFMVSRLIDKLQEDRIGIVIFAGDAFLQLPLTADYSAAKLMLSTIETDLIPGQGTAIGKAISIATEALPQDDKKHKVVIVVTDGENHEDDAIGGATEAAKRGIVVHTIGMLIIFYTLVNIFMYNF